jgi:hypothetical protein
MDGSDSRIVPFLPYILQDTWELGTDPETVIDLVRRQVEENEFLEGEVECAVLAIKRDRPR